MQKKADGWLSGIVGVAIFSGSLPATRVAVADLSPVFLTSARAVIAAAIAVAILFAFRAKCPAPRQLPPLAAIAVGVVIGFPLLSGYALQHISAARSLVFVGLLPLSTAVFGVLRGGERPRPAFWLFAVLGSACVIGFASLRQQAATLHGDLLMLAAIVACGYGYAEGGRLSRELGGWQVISWALVIALPVTLLLTLTHLPMHPAQVRTSSWIALAYVAIFSMLIGFFFWYRGLALGGIAAVGQLQLLQPFMGLALATLLLHEPVGWQLLAAALSVAACVAAAKRFSSNRAVAFTRGRSVPGMPGQQ
ncbi:DMT family transporter [Xanthomonas sp. AM6]|uniref:DMT family transporter n=1 Tax=Xanthomonas sp. AM6 TaxID=2982531 RepID=UPI0021D8AE26|nr:DMT family transporter [Xanthomonas sp. AM6]UYB54498.1 DMT family transporter [Xanthomonas sp. AM6]